MKPLYCGKFPNVFSALLRKQREPKTSSAPPPKKKKKLNKSLTKRFRKYRYTLENRNRARLVESECKKKKKKLTGVKEIL